MAKTPNTTHKAAEVTPKANPEGAPKASETPPDDTKALEHIQGAQAGIDHPAAAKAAQEGTNPVTATAAALKAQQEQDAEERRNRDETDLPETEGDLIADEIIGNYVPTLKSEQEIAADMREAIAQIQSATNEIEGTQASRIALDFADLIAYLLAIPKDSRPSAAIPGPGCAKNIVDYVRTQGLLGKESDYVVTDETTRVMRNGLDPETGKVVKLPVPTKSEFSTSPFKDRNLANKLQRGAERGWLIALGHKTSVCYGYAPKDRFSGKRWERTDVMLREEQIDGNNRGNYHKVISVPLNVVYPFQWIVVQPDAKKTDVFALVPGEPTEATELRPLMEDWSVALYNYHFEGIGKGAALSALTEHFDTGPGRAGKIPSGYLLRQPKALRGAQDQANNETVDRTLSYDEFQALSPEARKAQYEKDQRSASDARNDVLKGDPSSENFARFMAVLTKATHDEKTFQRMNSAAIANMLQMSFNVLRYISVRWFAQGKAPPVDIARELGAIQNLGIFCTPEGTNAFILDKEDKLIALDSEGNELGPLYENGKQFASERAENAA
jgi:hypothetical protein